MVRYVCFLYHKEPKNISKALLDEFWVLAMHDELDMFVRNDVWELVPRPHSVNVVGTKWIFKNKTDTQGLVVRNKACLMAQGYTQIEGVDFDETFAPVARVESIRLLLAISCVLNFTLFQMDVKSAFLNGILQEEVYIEQPKGFVITYGKNLLGKVNNLGGVGGGAGDTPNIQIPSYGNMDQVLDYKPIFRPIHD